MFGLLACFALFVLGFGSGTIRKGHCIPLAVCIVGSCAIQMVISRNLAATYGLPYSLTLSSVVSELVFSGIIMPASLLAGVVLGSQPAKRVWMRLR